MFALNLIHKHRGKKKSNQRQLNLNFSKMHNISRTSRYKLDKANSANVKQSPVKKKKNTNQELRNIHKLALEHLSEN